MVTSSDGRQRSFSSLDECKRVRTRINGTQRVLTLGNAIDVDFHVDLGWFCVGFHELGVDVPQGSELEPSGEMKLEVRVSAIDIAVPVA